MYLDNTDKLNALIEDNYACMKHDAHVWHCSNCPISKMVEELHPGMALICADGRATDAAIKVSALYEEGRRIEQERYDDWRASQ